MSTCDAMSTRSSYGKRSRALLSMAARNPQQELIGANVTAPRATPPWRHVAPILRVFPRSLSNVSSTSQLCSRQRRWLAAASILENNSKAFPQ